MSSSKIGKRIIILISIAFFISLLVIIALRNFESNSYKNRATVFIEQVEKFKTTNGVLPNTISECGLSEEMGDGPYYKKINDDFYMVYFNIGFDDAVVYYSDTKTWEDYFRKNEQ